MMQSGQQMGQLALEVEEDLPLVPKLVRSKDGQLIDTTTDTWTMLVSADGRSVRRISWIRLEQIPSLIIASRTLQLFKLFLVYRIPRTKTLTVYNDFEAFRAFIHWYATQYKSGSQSKIIFSWADVDEQMARRFLHWCVKNQANQGNAFGRIRVFYEWGSAQKYAEFDSVLSKVLRTIKAPSNLKGHRVRIRDPFGGPLSPDEIALIAKAIDEQKGSEQDRSVVMLHLELGINPNATMRLQGKDLRRFEADGKTKYQLDVPRMKKRTPYRETRRRPISPALGEILEQRRLKNLDGLLFHWLGNHYPEVSIRASMRRFIRDANVISPRTGALLHINPRRFRYSLATYMAEEGASKLLIADVLDHMTLYTVDVYTATVSSIAEHMGRAVDPVLGPVVHRFLGVITDSLAEPLSADIPNQIIPASVPQLPVLMLDTGGVGLCGRDVRIDGLCRLFPPLSCYICPSFHALRSGPHKALLDHIDAFIRDNQGVVSERVLGQLNHVRLAISQVLEQLTHDFNHRAEGFEAEG